MEATAVGDVGREVGIPAIGHAPWGTHFCQFYRTKQDLLDIVGSFFRAGLHNNEVCVWVTGEQWVDGGQVTVQEATEAMRAMVPDFDRHLELGQMEIIPYTNWYVRDGVFQEENVLTGWQDKLKTALARGFDGLRGSGTTFWLEKRNWPAFTDYEHTVDQLVAQGPLLGICTYSLEQCGPEEIFDVLKNHAFALVKNDAEWVMIEPSERKKATEAVERMNRALAERTAQLQDALADLHGFTRWLSHDLKAPLRAINSFSEILAAVMHERVDDDEAHMLQRIQHNAARADRLVTDVLAYSRAQRSDLHAEPVNMQALALKVCADLADTTAHQQVQLAVGDLPPAYGDPAMISQLLANLIGNAVKFSRHTPGARVEIGATTIGAETVYHVRDNGAGFDGDRADQLFVAFERAHDGKQYEGTGLGLTIVKEIVTRHGGRVWAEGSPGAGATFFFTLPTPPTTADPAGNRRPRGSPDRP